MTYSVTRLLQLLGLLVLCLMVPGTAESQSECAWIVCAPGSPGCVNECSCEGTLGCCIQKCTQCCNSSLTLTAPSSPLGAFGLSLSHDLVFAGDSSRAGGSSPCSLTSPLGGLAGLTQESPQTRTSLLMVSPARPR
jgi:hypothetical protein